MSFEAQRNGSESCVLLLKLTEIVRHFSSIKKSDVLCLERDMFQCRNQSADGLIYCFLNGQHWVPARTGYVFCLSVCVNEWRIPLWRAGSRGAALISVLQVEHGCRLKEGEHEKGVQEGVKRPDSVWSCIVIVLWLYSLQYLFYKKEKRRQIIVVMHLFILLLLLTLVMDSASL